MKTPLYILVFCVVVASEFSEGDDNTAALPDLALQPPRVLTEFGPHHVKSSRGAQGVPGIERSMQGRLWAAWYAGRSQRGVESSSSYCVLATSGDHGQSWSEKLVIQPRRFVHTYDPCLWIDPQRRLWFFWAQSAGVQDGRMGVWAMVTTDADSETPEWSQPRRIANGVMLNKPTVLKNGDWLLPVGLWRDNTNVPNVKFDADELAPYTIEMLTHDLGDERGSNVYRSTDQGKSFERIGQVRIPGTRVDEHMIVERGDGSLWMLLRNTGGIAQSVSTDGGRTWSDGSLYLQGRDRRKPDASARDANKRFFIRRLNSGALLMVRNNSPDGKRSHMTAFVSDDDGATWKGGLLLDERESSYPDGIQALRPPALHAQPRRQAGSWLRTNGRVQRRRRSRGQTRHGQSATLSGRDTTAEHERYAGNTGEMQLDLPALFLFNTTIRMKTLKRAASTLIFHMYNE